MSFPAVVVEHTNSRSDTVSNCGLRISNNFIITTGALLEYEIRELFKNESDQTEFFRSNKTITDCLNKNPIKIKVYEEKASPNNLIVEPEYGKKVYNYVKSEKNTLAGCEGKKASLVYFLCHGGTQKVLQNMVSADSGFKFDQMDDEEALDVNTIILSSFLLLEMDLGGVGDIIHALQNAVKNTIQPHKGCPILLISTPFGSSYYELFTNSMSKGIVCANSSCKNIFVSDARSIHGCGGAPAFTSYKGRLYLCGFLLLPFCWHHGQWMGLTMMASALPILTSLLRQLGPSMTHSKGREIDCFKNLIDHHQSLEFVNTCSNNDASIAERVNYASKCVVSILLDETQSHCRGSGFIVNGDLGIIITCAHVVRNSHNKKVDVVDFSGHRLKGDIIFNTDESRHIWDLAVIVVPRKFSHFLQLSTEVPPQGFPVIAGGFGPFERLWPCYFSSGMISKVTFVPKSALSCEGKSTTSLMAKGSFTSNSDNRLPCYLQTTCDVYKGSSGGPVVAASPHIGPVVLGVVASCVEDSSNKARFAQLNFAACAFGIAEAVKRFAKTRNPQEFRCLLIKGEGIPFLTGPQKSML